MTEEEKKKAYLYLMHGIGRSSDGSVGPIDITYDLFGVVGESNAGDTTASTTYGPVTPAGISMKWNTSSFIDVAATDFNNQAGVYGTFLKQFALTRYNKTGRGTQIVNGAAGGSEFYPNGDNNNWYTSGTCYAAFQTKMSAALAATGKSVPDGILVWLGTNDITAATTEADILTGITSLFSRLMTDYPGVRILVMSTAVNGSTTGMTSRKFFMKKAFRDLEDANTVIELFANADSYSQRGYSNVIHFTQDGYNAAGDQAARCQVSSYGKQTRVAVSQYDTDIGATKEAAWDTFVNWCISNGCWKTTALDKLQIFVSDTSKNLWNDFTNMQTPLNSNVDFNIKESIGIDGANSKYIIDNLITSFGLRNTTSTDYYDGCKVHTNSIASGAAAVLFEDNTTGARRRLLQTATPSVIVNNVTSTNMTTTVVTSFANDSYQSIGRGGTTEEYLVNGAVIATRTSTAGSVSTNPLLYGGMPGSSLWIGKISAVYRIKRTGVNISAFEAQLTILLNALAV